MVQTTQTQKEETTKAAKVRMVQRALLAFLQALQSQEGKQNKLLNLLGQFVGEAPRAFEVYALPGKTTQPYILAIKLFLGFHSSNHTPFTQRCHDSIAVHLQQRMRQEVALKSMQVLQGNEYGRILRLAQKLQGQDK